MNDTDLKDQIARKLTEASATGGVIHQNSTLVDETIEIVVADLHASIMRGELRWPTIREDAWLNGTIHRWLDQYK